MVNGETRESLGETKVSLGETGHYIVFLLERQVSLRESLKPLYVNLKRPLDMKLLRETNVERLDRILS